MACRTVVTKGPYAGSRYEVTLDPNVDYLVTSVVAYIADSDPSPANVVPIRTQRKILEFTDLPDGGRFPKRVVAKMFDGRAAADAPPAVEQELIASETHVNANLPKDALNFTFPVNAVVYEMPPVNGSYPMHIWGNNNKAAKTYTGDYADFRFPPKEELATELGAEAQPRQYLRVVMFVATLVIIIILASVIYRRRIASQSV